MSAPTIRYAPNTPREPCVGANNADSLRASMLALFGSAVMTAALAKVPAEARDEFTSFLTVGWVRSTTMESVVQAVAEQLGRTSDSVYDELMRHGAQRWFKLKWKLLLGLVGDEALVSRSAMVYAHTRNTGELRGKLIAPGRAELVLTDWPGVPARSARNFAIGIEMILLASGRVDPAVRFVASPEGGSFYCTWRSR